MLDINHCESEELHLMCILLHSFHELVVVLLARFLRNTILLCAALNWLTNSSKFEQAKEVCACNTNKLLPMEIKEGGESYTYTFAKQARAADISMTGHFNKQVNQRPIDFTCQAPYPII